MRFVQELLKLPVFDSQNLRVGHLHDLAFQRSEDYPKISCLAIMAYEVESVAGYAFLQAAHNVTLVVSWEEVAQLTTSQLLLKKPWRETVLYSWGKEEVFLGRDLLDVQIVDSEGHRVQRVDDLILELKNNNLFLAGIYAGFGSRLDRLNLAKASAHLLKTMGIKVHEHIIPWTSVETYGPGHEEIKLNVGAREKM